MKPNFTVQTSLMTSWHALRQTVESLVRVLFGCLLRRTYYLDFRHEKGPFLAFECNIHVIGADRCGQPNCTNVKVKGYNFLWNTKSLIIKSTNSVIFVHFSWKESSSAATLLCNDIVWAFSMTVSLGVFVKILELLFVLEYKVFFKVMSKFYLFRINTMTIVRLA